MESKKNEANKAAVAAPASSNPKSALELLEEDDEFEVRFPHHYLLFTFTLFMHRKIVYDRSLKVRMCRIQPMQRTNNFGKTIGKTTM